MELKNEHLRVCFALPEEFPSQRFDNTARITRVWLGDHAFCTPEQLRPERRTTGGVGLTGEFVLEKAAQEAAAGEWFLKPGVGLLRQKRGGAPYDMWCSYEMRTFPVESVWKKDQVTFLQSMPAWNGYGLDIQKVFRLEANSLILDITLRNTGSKGFSVQEYQHNFLSLEKPVDAGYVLELPCDEDFSSIPGQTLRQGDEAVMPSAVAVRGREAHWTGSMENRVLYHRSGNVSREKPYMWKLWHKDSPLWVTEECGFRPSRIDIWAVEHCVCPEMYFSAEIAPGETAGWQRIWRFGADEEKI